MEATGVGPPVVPEVTTTLFVATDRNRCADSVDRLETVVDDGVEVVGATDLDGVRRAMREAAPDCVVFGENPLSPEGSNLMDLVELCRRPEESVPLVLFTDATYGPGAARSTEGVTDYVRADTEGAFEHLADRVRWLTDDEEDDDWYETLVESMDDGVLVVEDGRVRYANGAMADALGVDRGDLEGTTLRALAADGLLREADVRAVETAARTVAAGEADSLSPELEVDPEEGDARTIELNVVALPGAGPGAAMATVRAVTEYKRAESALEEARDRIDRLHEAAEAFGACRTREELFEHGAEAAADILGADVCGVDELIDGRLRPRATVGGDYRSTDVAEGVAGRAFRAGESVLADVGDRPGESAVAGARSVLAVPVDDDGLLRAVATEGHLDERDRNVAELLAAHLAESLDRVRVGETLRERERDLVAERERLLALFEAVPSPAVAYEFQGGRPVIREVNPSFESVFGVDQTTAVGDPLDRHVHPPEGADVGTPALDADAPDGFLDRLRAGEACETAVRRETADGVEDFLVHAGPLADDDAGEGYVVYTNISDQKARERELAEHNERLDRLAEIASEDLRDRLNDARGYLELASETGDEASFGEVRRAHERMSRLIDDLRFLVDDDPTVENPQPVGLEKATTRAWAGVETGAVELSVEDATVLADPDRLVELIERLLRNAVDHATPGEADPMGEDIDGDGDGGVIVRVRPLGDEGFYVEDTGVGIPAVERDRVFESGYSTAEGAAGLGLTVVRRIAEAHGWSVTVSEAPGGGARFEFRTGEDVDPGIEADREGALVDESTVGAGADVGTDVDVDADANADPGTDAEALSIDREGDPVP